MPLNDTTNEIPYGYCHCGCGKLTELAPRTNRNRGWVKGKPIHFVHGHNRHRVNAARFWEKVNKDTPNGCWEWTGSRMRFGHGQIHIDGKSVLVHRFAWELENGPIPTGMEVCHHCDQPSCVRVSHLFLGTQADNMTDMVNKGRQERGDTHHYAKLSETEVIEIRRRYAQGAVCQKELASEYGTSVSNISTIVRRRNWQHVP